MQMAMLFIIVGVGYASKKVGWMDQDFDKAFSKVILNAVLPCMILGSVLAAETLPTPEQLVTMFAFGTLSYVVMLVVGLVVTWVMRISHGHRGVFRYMMLFGNVGFIGFPVITAIFGPEALLYAGLYQFPFNILAYTLGAYFLTQDNEYGVKVKVSPKVFLSPAVISCLVAVVLTVLGIHNVPVLGPATETLGSMTTPGALLIIGSSLANLPLRELTGGPRLWISAAVRLLVTPVLVLLLFSQFNLDPVILGVIVILCGMPVATNGTMMCYEYGGDAKTMSQGTFITTVFCLLTIPLLSTLLTAFGL
ncbi:MAG: AEC family transporter [Coriobacteriia bacterium]|nr:AEC family transporter [Coriobacteriia bacterium]